MQLAKGQAAAAAEDETHETTDVYRWPEVSSLTACIISSKN
jgi:hypothetical protein